jgi:Zn-finger nucleic acid-binding protein
MSDSWDERRRAQEEGYFERANKEALLRLAAKKAGGTRNSPATGKPMEQLALNAIIIDRCNESGGVWLDKGELEQIMTIAKENREAVQGFIEALLKGAHAPSETSQGVAMPAEMKSPVSGNLMQEENLFGLSVYRCQESGGLWIDARKLSEMLKSLNPTQLGSVMEYLSLVLQPKASDKGL